MHGIKGDEHGCKGGRPLLDLTDDELAEGRFKHQEVYRRRQGIPHKKARRLKVRPTNWVVDDIAIWSKRTPMNIFSVSLIVFCISLFGQPR
jgi:hypothetical protein